MTSEEAIKTWLPIISMGINSMPELKEAFDMAIKALEQESILDKITEITKPLRRLSIDEMSDIEWQILQVIDKYKTESGDKE